MRFHHQKLEQIWLLWHRHKFGWAIIQILTGLGSLLQTIKWSCGEQKILVSLSLCILNGVLISDVLDDTVESLAGCLATSFSPHEFVQVARNYVCGAPPHCFKVGLAYVPITFDILCLCPSCTVDKLNRMVHCVILCNIGQRHDSLVSFPFSRVGYCPQ